MIKGILWMMFYVFVPIGIGSIGFFQCLTIDLGAEVEKRAFPQAKLLLLGFSRNLKLIESDMFSYRELVTAQWDVFFLSQQRFEHVSTGKRNTVA